MRKALLAAALGATVLASGGALYAQAAPRGPDANGDGIVTRVEAMAHADARFAKLDVNADGKIAGDEMTMKGRKYGRGGGFALPPPPGGPGGPGGMRGKWQAMMDTNKDGTVSTEERAAGRAAMIARIDTDKDGTISAEERQAARATLMAGRGDMPPPGAGTPPPPPGVDAPPPPKGKWGKHGGGRGRGMARAMLMQADTDKDGAITKAEFRTGAEARFAAVDTNKDGRIDSTEHDAAKAARKAMKDDMRERRGGPPPVGTMPPPPPPPAPAPGDE